MLTTLLKIAGIAILGMLSVIAIGYLYIMNEIRNEMNGIRNEMNEMRNELKKDKGERP